MKNIEIKARCPDPSSIRRRLAQRGVNMTARLHQIDTYFVVPHGRLKLREIDGEPAQLIHYHRPDAHAARASDYVIVPVPEPGPLKEALVRALGIRTVVEKQRELYLWGQTRIHLDAVAGLGSFLELETVITTQPQEEAERECRRVWAALGLREEDLAAGSYAEMMT